MTSPQDTSILSSSPISFRASSPNRRRSRSPEDLSDLATRTKHSPTRSRPYDPTDPEVRERQLTMDVDMAMHLHRARRETLHALSPISPYDPTHSRPPLTQSSPERSFPNLSTLASHTQQDTEGISDMLAEADADQDYLHIHSPPSSTSLQHLSQTHDPALLVPPEQPSLANAREDPSAANYGLPTYQANASRTNFDFSTMEEFAAAEKKRLGLSTPAARFASGTTRGKSSSFDISSSTLGQENLPGGEPSESNSQRPLRQRKLSSSSPRTRQRKGIGAKMALFENTSGEPPSSLSARLGLILSGQPESSYDAGASGTSGLPPSGILNTGHDRTLRFSFYSNALSTTLNARSLSELPPAGQTFEELFSGIHPPSDAEADSPNDRRHNYAFSSQAAGRTSPAPGAFGGFQRPPDFSAATSSNNRRSLGPDAKMGEPVHSDNDTDSNTWWLDVQNPTDEEMKMLSKVFSIHPLTTEDILMEETREKIELFRNYYFVCFRSFDQDPYSPTRLEPLNMYIIVFREGILSFHIRSTPHSENVRRRIKQLKDYISVTSDWISYALIDDITDAFGPLIQSIEYEVDSIDELVLILKEAEQSDMLRRIGTCRKKVMGLLRLMGNKADVVKGLAKRCNENWRVAPTSDIGLYLSDIQDHLITMTQNLNHYEKILSRSHSNYLAQISIEMTDANNQINDVLSKLTALGTVLVPMNLVTGLWGMNVHVPGEDTREGCLRNDWRVFHI
ncbi:hypothetical protein AGABI2DRAFT_188581 [Agaricus bisporus var. bisporus H97]|uniref:hypothetical protein n=1 Tax=Agaricus bisporus var. bisporus (strain H97 / ATCC MYA-4626 / FGSC 10389) TaxID=936046 RepID=UPI00029F6A02|nr:hypothetical protein AGABI2DRAFT_188581 [Agaricus bisporus var. bisporus H97]EKV42413.1 hypothetical protein AGABI2DRAFT_188581 [Agaricus bisporus var. bisporus H97]